MVNPFTLGVAFGNNESLVSFNGTVGLVFDFVYPFVANDLLPRRKSG